MTRSLLAKTEMLIGVGLLAIAAVLFANSYLCLFNKASCGMVEPILAFYASLFGASFLGGGLLRGRNGLATASAYIPALFAALVLAYQASGLHVGA
jgi:hypothetical protein